MAVKNQIVWCDIPVKDLDRAIKFYSAVLEDEVTKQSFPGGSFGLLPHVDKAVGGTLVAGEEFVPSVNGAMIYLNCDQHLDESLLAVEENGGQILQPKHSIGAHGFRAVVLDSEGNRIGLHSI